MTTKIPVELSSTPSIVDNGDATAITIDSSENVGIGTSSPTQRLHVDGGSSLIKSSYDATGTTNVYQYFATRASGNWRNSTIGNTGNALVFGTGGTGTTHTNATERMRIDSSGNLLVGRTSTLGGATDDYMTVANVNAGRGGIRIGNTSGSSNTSCMRFHNSNGAVGAIRTSGSATFYDTSSDYRLKENVNYEFDALSRVAKLKPARFNFIADADTTVDGFIAHEVSDIVPEAITGEKDGEEMQGIDHSKLVPLLTKAIQEQQTQIEELRQKIETLKN